jgi:hypothetical protein
MNVHKESYVDIFDKEKLVYLTPHCRNELIDYNHDDIYIVGAMVDKANNEPISLAKAKKLGLRMAKLPLSKFLHWGIGGKSLTIDQMVQIMLEMRVTDNWERSLRFVPKRKLFNDNLNQTHKIKNPYWSQQNYQRDSFQERDSYQQRDNYQQRDSYQENYRQKPKKVTITKNFLSDDYREEEGEDMNDDRAFERRQDNNYNQYDRQQQQPRSKERKHFENYFDLDTWGSKKKNNGSGDR